MVNKCCNTCGLGKTCQIKSIVNADNFWCVSYVEAKKQLPTHAEIMTKWWKGTSSWFKVLEYMYSEKEYIIQDQGTNDYAVSSVNKSWFTDKESADMPPEVQP